MKTAGNQLLKKGPMTVDPYSRLVALPVQSENIFHFPEGLPAFESVKEFVFLCKPDTRPFFFMQSLNPADLAFVCIDPFLICSGYEPRISDADVKCLHLESMEDALLISIVTVTKDMRDITTNLQGPIVINIRASLGKQIICDGQNYPVRYRVWDMLDHLEKQESRAMEQPGATERQPLVRGHAER
ncbi:MAG: flagellar assembly protein FliW [Syntrophaceae bacterium]|nr:flagellar assembly protein FliW [Syntrophaceae bacterium]